MRPRPEPGQPHAVVAPAVALGIRKLLLDHAAERVVDVLRVEREPGRELAFGHPPSRGVVAERVVGARTGRVDRHQAPEPGPGRDSVPEARVAGAVAARAQGFLDQAAECIVGVRHRGPRGIRPPRESPRGVVGEGPGSRVGILEFDPPPERVVGEQRLVVLREAVLSRVLETQHGVVDDLVLDPGQPVSGVVEGANRESPSG